MPLHPNARGDLLPAASRQGAIDQSMTDGLRCDDGTGCDGNRSACGRVHVGHRVALYNADKLDGWIGRPCSAFLVHFGIFFLGFRQ